MPIFKLKVGLNGFGCFTDTGFALADLVFRLTDTRDCLRFLTGLRAIRGASLRSPLLHEAGR